MTTVTLEKQEEQIQKPDYRLLALGELEDIEIFIRFTVTAIAQPNNIKGYELNNLDEVIPIFEIIYDKVKKVIKYTDRPFNEFK